MNQKTITTFDRHVLDINCASVIKRIEQTLREQIGRQLHRRGAVVGVSGGVDSAVCVALAVRALGPERVVGLLMPERDSSPDSTARGGPFVKPLGSNATSRTSLRCLNRWGATGGATRPSDGCSRNSMMGTP